MRGVVCALSLCVLCGSSDGRAASAKQWIDFMFSPVVRRENGKIDKPFTVLTVAAVAGNSLDYFSTRYAIFEGAAEANPGMAPMFNHEPAAAGFKLGLINMVIITGAKRAAAMRGKKRIVGYVVLSAEAGLFTWVTVHNVQVAQSAR